ncbi:MAG: tetratricopeptide repeat protein [Candidatus Heimdallarchaeota archaeon]|nr:MAG: tetratricopeptide repeat protein [Candidatus Heimdallarchaeota archaeon]
MNNSESKVTKKRRKPSNKPTSFQNVEKRIEDEEFNISSYLTQIEDHFNQNQLDTALVKLTDIEAELKRKHDIQIDWSDMIDQLIGTGNYTERVVLKLYTLKSQIMSKKLHFAPKEASIQETEKLANEQVKTLGKLTHYLERKDPDLTHKYCQLALALIKDYELDHFLYSSFYLQLASIYLAKGELEKSIAYQRKYLFQRSAPRRTWECSLMTNWGNNVLFDRAKEIAEFYTNKGEVEEAITFLLEWLEILQGSFDKRALIPRASEYIANLSIKAGDNEAANHYLLKALALSEKMRYEPLTIKLLLTMANRQIQIEDSLNQAIDTIEKALLGLETWENQYIDIVRYVNILDLDYKDTTNFDIRLEYYFRALEYWEEKGNSQFAGLCLQHIGQIYLKQGKPDQAIQFWLKNLELINNSEDPREIARSQYRICQIYNMMGNHEEVFYHWNELQTLLTTTLEKYIIDPYWSYRTNRSGWRKLSEGNLEFNLELMMDKESKKEISDNLLLLGFDYFKDREFDRALEVLEQFLNLHKPSKRLEDQAKCNLILGWIFKIQGEGGLALHYIEESIRQWKKLGKEEEVCQAQLLIGEIYYLKGERNKVFFMTDR